jgi:prolyl 4-hydroxylase
MNTGNAFLLLLLNCAEVAVEAFMPPTERQFVPSVVSKLGVQVNCQESFWGKERSRQEVESHVSACLAEIDHEQDLTDEKVHVLSAEPPLVVIHDFLSATMCQAIIQAALDSDRMQRSTTANSQKTSDTRTSSTTWLKDGECQTPLRLIAEKVASICGLPPANMEHLQVAHYTLGQEFAVHTDHNDSFNDLECRGRLATCLIYLAEPTDGGETWFPDVNSVAHQVADGVKIPATQGSAVFFWNTVEKPGSANYDSEMFLRTDLRMKHAGLPILEGEKWVCNRWIHPIDFKGGVRGF